MKPHWPKVQQWQGAGSMIDALLGLLQQSPPSAETKLDRQIRNRLRYESLLGDDSPKGASLQSQKDIARSLRLLGDSNIAPRPKEKPEQLSPNSALKEPNFIPKLIKISNKLNMLPEQLLGAISLETIVGIGFNTNFRKYRQ